MAALNFLSRNANLSRLTQCIRKYNEKVIQGHSFVRSISRSKASEVTSAQVGQDSGDETDQPVKYSTSNAATWTVRNSYGESKTKDAPPVGQDWSVIISLTVFMLYFCVFREENDLDDEFSMSLYDRVEGMEEVQIKLCIRYNEDHGLDTKDLKARLAEIENEKRLKESKTSELQQ